MSHTWGMTNPIAEEIDASIAGQNVQQRFLASAKGRPDAVVLRWKDPTGEWASWTNAGLMDQTARLVTALKELGVGKGDRVVLMLTNRPEFHPLDLAVLFCGATPVSIYSSSAPEQIDYLVNHCGAKVAIVENASFVDRFEAVRSNLTSLEHLFVMDSEGTTDVGTFASLIEADPADLDACAGASQPDDLATVIYTSGTTGVPKGVMLTHYNVCWTLASLKRAFADQTDIGDIQGKSYVSYLPMAHIFERLLGHYQMLDSAIEVSCCPDTKQVAAIAAEVHPNMFIGVPRVWEKFYAGVNAVLAADPEKAQKFNEAVEAAIPIMEKMTEGTATDEEIETWNFLDAVAFSQVTPLLGLDQVDIAISGAAPIPVEILTWFRAIGVPLTEGYGMSENTAVISWAHKARAGYVGKPFPGIEIVLGEDGEVLARGGNMFPGYLDAPDKTAESLDDEGWVHTGDIGEFDDDGYLKIIDRKKELIITAGGKNISPANLEAALKMIPLVGQACAIGDQRPFVSALVVLDPDAAAVWAAAHGLDGPEASMEALAENRDVLAEIDEGLADAMSTFNNAEAVKKVKVLGQEWLPDSEMLTPTSKLKRRGIHSTFAEEIEQLYIK